MPGWWSTRAPTRSSSPTTAADSSTGRRRRWSGCPRSCDAVGDRAEVYLDGGVLSGGDVVAAVALGARAVLVGRAYLYGLMAGGERGVQRAADILAAEVRGTMALLGVTRVGDLRPRTASGCGGAEVRYGAWTCWRTRLVGSSTPTPSAGSRR